MRAIVTGGAGFLGDRVVRRLLEDGADRVAVVDLVPPRPDLAGDPRVETVVGDLAETVPALVPADLVVHLAAVVSGAAERDFDLGMQVNLDATRAVLERARAWGTVPTLVFSSSLAVFGADPWSPTPPVIDDDTLPRPQSSYGIQKFIGEQLVADYTRKGFVRGRTVRLMTVAVRPGAPNAAASSFVSGIIREPIAGAESTCPVDPDLPIALSSPRRTVDGIIAAATAGEEWGSRTAMNLPALTTSPREMAAALDRVAGDGTSARIRWERDPAVEAIVGSWPARFRTDRARALGLGPETSFDDVVRAYLEGGA
ncbi:MAG: NAD-dependent epimerase/dehydratase family protein [Microbacteriaceae bacterium]|nr:NAD-dependent epimerase/dehydratase family protein [Microbacteriaceae bacterium]